MSTIIGQFFDQERIVRDAPSASAWSREIHRVKMDATGETQLFSHIAKPVAVFTGEISSIMVDESLNTKEGGAAYADIDGVAWDTNTDMYTFRVFGTPEKEYCFEILGFVEGR